MARDFELRDVVLKTCENGIVAITEAYCKEQLGICQTIRGKGWIVLHIPTGSTLTVSRTLESAVRAVQELLNLGDALDVDLWDYNFVCEFPELTHEESQILAGVLRKYFLT